MAPTLTATQPTALPVPVPEEACAACPLKSAARCAGECLYRRPEWAVVAGVLERLRGKQHLHDKAA